MILLIDNYDSFTYNLYQYMGIFTPDIKVVRNDKITMQESRLRIPRKSFFRRDLRTRKRRESVWTWSENIRAGNRSSASAWDTSALVRHSGGRFPMPKSCFMESSRWSRMTGAASYRNQLTGQSGAVSLACGAEGRSSGLSEDTG